MRTIFTFCLVKAKKKVSINILKLPQTAESKFVQIELKDDTKRKMIMQFCADSKLKQTEMQKTKKKCFGKKRSFSISFKVKLPGNFVYRKVLYFKEHLS